jgi:hypothetical protein
MEGNTPYLKKTVEHLIEMEKEKRDGRKKEDR